MKKSKFKLKTGEKVSYRGENHSIYKILDFNSVLLKDKNNISTRASITELYEEIISENKVADKYEELNEISEKDWEEAKKKFKIIEPLLRADRTSEDVKMVVKSSNVSKATLYRWIKLYENSENISSLLNTKRTGGKDQSRLIEDLDVIITSVIEKEYLTKQRKSIQKVYEIVKREASRAGIVPPHSATVRRRIKKISGYIASSKRIDKKQADILYKPMGGNFPGANTPLSVVQIDHTTADIILVDEINRRPLGRPHITVCLDVYSRMILGFYTSFDPAGAIGTGICIANSILPKDKLLAKYEVDGEWPCWGVMNTIHVDNAKEFHGSMLMRACEQHGINLEYRPVGQPNWGGNVERVIKTLMQEVHTLPGTTFSNPSKRKGYDSDKNASMTLFEFEKWLTNYIVNVYHKKLHQGINMSPFQKYQNGIFGNKETGELGIGLPDRFLDERKIRLDFLPFFNRAILPYGVLIEHIYYYHDIFKNYINNLEKIQNKSRTKIAYVFKRDPRDISIIYFWDNETKEYIDIPYRDFTNPPMSIWEYRLAIKDIKNKGIASIDEKKIFEAYDKMNTIISESKAKTNKAKRSGLKSISRSTLRGEISETKKLPVTPTSLPYNFNIKPFDEQDNGTS